MLQCKNFICDVHWKINLKTSEVLGNWKSDVVMFFFSHSLIFETCLGEKNRKIFPRFLFLLHNFSVTATAWNFILSVTRINQWRFNIFEQIFSYCVSIPTVVEERDVVCSGVFW